MKTKNNTRKLVLTALFGAIIIILNFSPIGYIQLPLVKATIIHVPVIIGSILLGSKIGASLGIIFGLTSLYNNTFMPTVLSFAFSPLIPLPGTDSGSLIALVITFLPRILVGIFPYYAYKWFNQLLKGKYKILSFGISGVIGSMTNTFFVMHLIYYLFRDSYGQAYNIAISAVYKTMLAVIFTNGIPEAILAAIITGTVCNTLRRYSN